MERKCLNYTLKGNGDNCTDYEKCAKQMVCPPTRHHCFLVWELDNSTTPSSPKVVSGGCIQSYDGTECDTQCIGQPKGPKAGTRIFYCCCASDLCNMRFITPPLALEPPIEQTPDKRDEINEIHPTSSNVLWIIIPILLIVILVSIYIYWYRRGKSARSLHKMVKTNSNNSNRRNKGITSNLNDRELTELRNNNDISLIVPFRNQFGDEHFFNNNNNNNHPNRHPNDPNNVCNSPMNSNNHNNQRASSVTNNHEATSTMQNGSRIDLKSIRLLEIIGSGRFGTVHRALVENNTDPSEVAVKVILSSEQQSWLNETQIYSTPRVKHPNILKFFHSEENLSGENYWLVVEYAAKGSLYSFLKDNVVNWKEFLYIALGIVHGLSHLHEADIAHRDFKSKNILLKEDLTPCITDFGVASILDSSTGSQLDQRKKYLQVGTPRYMAPEVLECSVTFTKASFTKIDVYALSLVLWELLTRCYPLPKSAQHRFDLNYQDYLLETGNYNSAIQQQPQQQYQQQLQYEQQQQQQPQQQQEQEQPNLNPSHDEISKEVINNQDQSMSQSNGFGPPPYTLPFEDVAGSNPDIIKMRQIVVVDKLRPAIRDEWRTYPASEFCRAIEDGWEYDHDARISASCFVERVESLPKS